MTFLLHDKEAEFDFPVFNYILWLLSSVTKMLEGHFLWLCQDAVLHYCCFSMSHRIYSLQSYSSLLFSLTSTAVVAAVKTTAYKKSLLVGVWLILARLKKKAMRACAKIQRGISYRPLFALFQLFYAMDVQQNENCIRRVSQFINLSKGPEFLTMSLLLSFSQYYLRFYQ